MKALWLDYILCNMIARRDPNSNPTPNPNLSIS